MGINANGLRNRFGALSAKWIHVAYGTTVLQTSTEAQGAADLKKSIAKIGGKKGKGKADREERVTTPGELTSRPWVLPCGQTRTPNCTLADEEMLEETLHGLVCGVWEVALEGSTRETNA